MVAGEALGDLPACIDRMIQKQCSTDPEAIAIDSWDRKLSYGELDRVSNRLAHHFVSVGIVEGCIVPVVMEKSATTICIVVALLKLHVTFVLLDFNCPSKRLEAVMQQTRASHVVCSSKTLQKAQHVDHGSTVCIDDETIQLAAHTVHEPRCLHENNLAYVAFTSGSTGAPKGALVSHRAYIIGAKLHIKAFNLTPRSRVFQYASYSFDTSVQDILSTLLAGGCLCICSEHERENFLDLAVSATNSNWMHITPSLARILNPSDFKSIETLILGGEIIEQEVVKSWSSHCSVIGSYGLCETAVTCFVQDFSEPGTSANDLGVPIGCSYQIVDSRSQEALTDVGDIGELVLKGPILTCGYLTDLLHPVEKATAREVFSNLRHHVDLSLPTFATGDLVRLTSNGHVQAIGRLDSRVKINGQRVELGEIEAYLNGCDDVKASIVLYPKAGRHAFQLTALVELATPPNLRNVFTSPSADSRHNTLTDVLAKRLSSRLQQYLGETCIPKIYLIFDSLPRLLTGKLDRAGSQEWLCNLSTRTIGTTGQTHPIKSRRDHDATFENTSTSVAALLQSIMRRKNFDCRSIDEASQIGLRSLGLDSIDAMEISMCLRKHRNIQIHMRDLLRTEATTQDLLDIELTQAGSSITSIFVSENPPKLGTRDISDFKTSLRNVSRIEIARRAFCNVLLTGATGFLGIHILDTILQNSQVNKVVVLIRCKSSSLGFSRLLYTAKAAGLMDLDTDKLVIWPGDLTKPDLGVLDSEFALLRGSGPAKDCITHVIHCGAQVHWGCEYSQLKQVNVQATADILKAFYQSPFATSFIFLSGGLLRFHDRTTAQLDDIAPFLGGYAQTKFIAEQMVHHFAKDTARWQQGPSVTILRPGLIIGASRNGLVAGGDYIWRIVATAVRLKMYNSDEDHAWLPLIGVDSVAQECVRLCLSTYQQHQTFNMWQGIQIKFFWKIVAEEVGCSIEPQDSVTWLSNATETVNIEGSSHPLFPVLHLLTDANGYIGYQRPDPMVVDDNSHASEQSLRSSIRYLLRIGVLTP